MGQVIAGRFELVEHIASGGSGSIWAAWDRRPNTWCAAKVLRHKDSGELLRFVREQGIQLDHPYLATPYGWAAEDEDVAISMPLVSGGTLDAAINDHGGFSSALASVLLLQLVDALEHVHTAGWIHRDVKPANILLEPTGEGRPHLRLGDFGIAVREDDPRFTMVGWVNGTPGYLAPEAMALAAPAAAQDLYAAGVVALRMLDPTLKGERGLEAAAAEPHEALGAIPDVDPRLAAVVAGLLEADPEARRAAAGRARDTLRPLAEPQTAAEGYLTAEGEPFVVFDQIPEDGLRAGGGSSDDDTGPAVSAAVRGAPAPRTASPAPWILMVLGALAVTVAAFLLWPRAETPVVVDSAATPTASASSASASGASSGAVADPRPATGGPSSAPATAASPEEGSPEERSPTISSSVSSGDDCTWLERGMVVTGADAQVLTCLDVGSALRWETSD
ncbi:serine/threonine-protein kinase [Citricoccus nitrophenolicus]|uniref:non-specific serine/threonine protein kinase n=1 Tax=Citricoccus nitrophenolicus TaxID=863575 RepID=A0ABV0IFP6_9MICC